MPDSELKTWLHHYQDESDAAFLYTVLASVEPDARKKSTYEKLAAVERRHTEMWAKLLADHGHPLPASGAAPSRTARVMAWLGRRFGPGYLLPLLLREEGREVKGYIDLHRDSSGEAARAVSLTLAKESAEHAGTLAGLAGGSAEPWHQTASGGFLRNVVYGFNDGLTANFGLVAGVIGARGLGVVFSSRGSEPFAIIAAAGLELQPRPGNSIRSQLRVGLRAGWLAAAEDGYGSEVCDDRGAASISSCSRLVVQGVIGWTALERIRLQVAGEWFPGTRTRRTSWSLAPGVGFELGF